MPDLSQNKVESVNNQNLSFEINNLLEFDINLLHDSSHINSFIKKYAYIIFNINEKNIDLYNSALKQLFNKFNILFPDDSYHSIQGNEALLRLLLSVNESMINDQSGSQYSPMQLAYSILYDLLTPTISLSSIINLFPDKVLPREDILEYNEDKYLSERLNLSGFPLEIYLVNRKHLSSLKRVLPLTRGYNENDKGMKFENYILFTTSLGEKSFIVSKLIKLLFPTDISILDQVNKNSFNFSITLILSIDTLYKSGFISDIDYAFITSTKKYFYLLRNINESFEENSVIAHYPSEIIFQLKLKYELRIKNFHEQEKLKDTKAMSEEIYDTEKLLDEIEKSFIEDYTELKRREKQGVKSERNKRNWNSRIIRDFLNFTNKVKPTFNRVKKKSIFENGDEINLDSISLQKIIQNLTSIITVFEKYSNDQLANSPQSRRIRALLASFKNASFTEKLAQQSQLDLNRRVNLIGKLKLFYGSPDEKLNNILNSALDKKEKSKFFFLELKKIAYMLDLLFDNFNEEKSTSKDYGYFFNLILINKEEILSFVESYQLPDSQIKENYLIAIYKGSIKEIIPDDPIIDYDPLDIIKEADFKGELPRQIILPITKKTLIESTYIIPVIFFIIMSFELGQNKAFIELIKKINIYVSRDFIHTAVTLFSKYAPKSIYSDSNIQADNYSYGINNDRIGFTDKVIAPINILSNSTDQFLRYTFIKFGEFPNTRGFIKSNLIGDFKPIKQTSETLISYTALINNKDYRVFTLSESENIDGNYYFTPISNEYLILTQEIISRFNVNYNSQTGTYLFIPKNPTNKTPPIITTQIKLNNDVISSFIDKYPYPYNDNLANIKSKIGELLNRIGSYQSPYAQALYKVVKNYSDYLNMPTNYSLNYAGDTLLYDLSQLNLKYLTYNISNTDGSVKDTLEYILKGNVDADCEVSTQLMLEILKELGFKVESLIVVRIDKVEDHKAGATLNHNILRLYLPDGTFIDKDVTAEINDHTSLLTKAILNHNIHVYLKYKYLSGIDNEASKEDLATILEFFYNNSTNLLFDVGGFLSLVLLWKKTKGIREGLDIRKVILNVIKQNNIQGDHVIYDTKNTHDQPNMLTDETLPAVTVVLGREYELKKQKSLNTLITFRNLLRYTFNKEKTPESIISLEDFIKFNEDNCLSDNANDIANNISQLITDFFKLDQETRTTYLIRFILIYNNILISSSNTDDIKFSTQKNLQDFIDPKLLESLYKRIFDQDNVK